MPARALHNNPELSGQQNGETDYPGPSHHGLIDCGAVPSADVRLLSVVIPCYNEADGLSELHRRVTGACRSIVGDGFEIILVNDGSRDESWPRMQSLAASDPQLVCVDLSRNHGHQLALTAGLTFAQGSHILILDADLQDPPELLGPMLQRMGEGFDIVYGQRRARAGETWFKRASASLFYRAIGHLSDVDIPRDTGDFRLMSRRALDRLLAMPENFRFIRGMVSWIGYRQSPLLFDRDARYAGETQYPLRRMIKFAIDAVTSFSIAPLRLASHLGLVAALGALVMIGFLILAWASGDTVPGWTSLAALVLFMGSIQLVMLGVIGEYLGRMYLESKRRPLFTVQAILSSEADEACDSGSPARVLQREVHERLTGRSESDG